MEAGISRGRNSAKRQASVKCRLKTKEVAAHGSSTRRLNAGLHVTIPKIPVGNAFATIRLRPVETNASKSAESPSPPKWKQAIEFKPRKPARSAESTYRASTESPYSDRRQVTEINNNAHDKSISMTRRPSGNVLALANQFNQSGTGHSPSVAPSEDANTYNQNAGKSNRDKSPGWRAEGQSSPGFKNIMEKFKTVSPGEDSENHRPNYSKNYSKQSSQPLQTPSPHSQSPKLPSKVAKKTSTTEPSGNFKEANRDSPYVGLGSVISQTQKAQMPGTISGVSEKQAHRVPNVRRSSSDQGVTTAADGGIQIDELRAKLNARLAKVDPALSPSRAASARTTSSAKTSAGLTSLLTSSEKADSTRAKPPSSLPLSDSKPAIKPKTSPRLPPKPLSSQSKTRTSRKFKVASPYANAEFEIVESKTKSSVIVDLKKPAVAPRKPKPLPPKPVETVETCSAAGSERPDSVLSTGSVYDDTFIGSAPPGYPPEDVSETDSGNWSASVTLTDGSIQSESNTDDLDESSGWIDEAPTTPPTPAEQCLLQLSRSSKKSYRIRHRKSAECKSRIRRQVSPKTRFWSNPEKTALKVAQESENLDAAIGLESEWETDSDGYERVDDQFASDVTLSPTARNYPQMDNPSFSQMPDTEAPPRPPLPASRSKLAPASPKGKLESPLAARSNHRKIPPPRPPPPDLRASPTVSLADLRNFATTLNTSQRLSRRRSRRVPTLRPKSAPAPPPPSSHHCSDSSLESPSSPVAGKLIPPPRPRLPSMETILRVIEALKQEEMRASSISDPGFEPETPPPELPERTRRKTESCVEDQKTPPLPPRKNTLLKPLPADGSPPLTPPRMLNHSPARPPAQRPTDDLHTVVPLEPSKAPKLPPRERIATPESIEINGNSGNSTLLDEVPPPPPHHLVIPRSSPTSPRSPQPRHSITPQNPPEVPPSRTTSCTSTSSSIPYNYIDPMKLDSYPEILQMQPPARMMSTMSSITDGDSQPDYLQLIEDDFAAINASIPPNESPFLLKDEPLYQIYHAGDFARSMLEQQDHDHDYASNELEPTDIYQTFEELTSISQEIEEEERLTRLHSLVKVSNGFRTLWSEMPKVVESGYLNVMSAEEKTIQETMFEIITSEMSYLKSLNLLISNFYEAPQFSEYSIECILDKRSKHTLFSNIVAVRDVSKKVMAHFEKVWEHDVILSSHFLVVLEKLATEEFSVYINYCQNQRFQERILRHLMETPSFAQSLLEMEQNPACQCLPLHSFLNLPMQRITRLPLLVDTILRKLGEGSLEYAPASNALIALQTVARQCNEAARQMENIEQMIHIKETLQFKNVKPLPLISQSRSLVKKGPLKRIHKKAGGPFGKRKENNFFLYLFNDLLIFTKKRSEDQYVVVDYAPRIHVEATYIEEEEYSHWLPNGVPSGCKNLFAMALLENHEGKSMEFIFACDSQSERLRWVEAVTPVQQLNEDERIYETWDCPQVQALHRYVSSEPDELSMEESDIINVYKKMGDGWYEGERIRDAQRGWFPSNHTVEIQSAHSRARNLRQKYRLLTLSKQILNQR